jgi:ribonuclease BN (tRNA processing enzyme)
VLFDCGPGVIANLARVCDPLALDAVFITHNHPDHIVDLYSLQAILRYAPEGPADRMALWTPPDLFERLACLLSDRGARELREAFDDRDLSACAPVMVKNLQITPHPVVHTDPTFALVAEADGVRLCYTADTMPGAAVLSAARGSDLLLAEATLPQQYAGRAPHLTAEEAGALAADAGAGELVLTHVWPTNDRARMAAEAAAIFSGPVSVASELALYEVMSPEERSAR